MVYQPAVGEDCYPTRYVGERTIEYLRRHAGEPFFVQCSFPDPHHPFTPPGRYWDMYDPAEVELPPSFFSSTRGRHRALSRNQQPPGRYDHLNPRPPRPHQRGQRVLRRRFARDHRPRKLRARSPPGPRPVCTDCDVYARELREGRIQPIDRDRPARPAGLPAGRYSNGRPAYCSHMTRRGVLGRRDVVELRLLHAAVERRLAGEAVQQHRQPPGEPGPRPTPFRAPCRNTRRGNGPEPVA